MQAINRTREHVLMESGRIAKGPWQRLKGLLGQPSPKTGHGLILGRPKVSLASMPLGIHTIGMKCAIDVLFLDHDSRVVHLIHSMKPYRISRLVWNSSMVLELPAGLLQQSGTRIGDEIELIAGDAAPQRANDCVYTGD